MLKEIKLQDEALLGCPASKIIAGLPHRFSQGILYWARETPNALALRTSVGDFTYLDLSLAVEESILLLRRAQVRAGDRVMLVCENGPAAIFLFIALSEMNAIAVVVNARLSEREIQLIESDCEPRRIFYPLCDSEAAAVHGLGSICEMSYGQVMMSEHSGVEPEMVYSRSEDQVVAMIYTTGTTGTPKGVMLTQRNLSFMAFVSGRLRQISSLDRIYCVLPISHIFGLSAVCCSVLSSGGSLHLAARFDAREVLKALFTGGITGLFGVPTMYALILDLIDVIDVSLVSNTKTDNLRFLYAGGSPLDPNLKQRVEARFGLPLHNGYGLTETGPTICQTRLYAPQSDCSVGFGLPCVAVEIRSSRKGIEGKVKANVVEKGEIGELWVKGPSVMKGYFRKPELTREVVQDGWFNTGDLAFQNEIGTYEIAGRTKELIIKSGFNVYPPEIEAILSEHPQVSLCAVVGRKRDHDEEILAFIQAVEDQDIDQDEIRLFARERLAAYKIPSLFFILEALPTSPSGKILKHRLLEDIT
ncbi:MAG: long-chain acyl-CoA synthetase [Candidatus Azotimanducaceae bacterium]|jgi:long-chain acyl-CoA synthetase